MNSLENKSSWKMNFLIIGAAKAGTSSLDTYLRQHPEIGMARRKELHMFDNEDLFAKNFPYQRMLENWFEQKEGIRCYGEATPSYLYWEPSLRRIWEYNPAMKLIALLRHPAKRAFSHWNMTTSMGLEQEDFLHCIKNERQRSKAALPLQHPNYSYVDRGFYASQIRRVWRFFPEEQVLFLKFEDYRKDPQATFSQVFEFLGVDPQKHRFMPQPTNVSEYSRRMTEEETSFLSDVFCNDIQEVERLLGWDCGDWRL